MGSTLRPIFRLIGDIRFTIFLLLKLFLLILFATFAQVDRGIFLANQLYFTSWFITFSSIPIFFGGYLIGVLLVFNYWRLMQPNFDFLNLMQGYLIHFGLVLLIIGSGLTSFFGREMQMSIAEGHLKIMLNTQASLNSLLLIFLNQQWIKFSHLNLMT